MKAQGWKKPPRKLPKHLQPHQDRKYHIKKKKYLTRRKLKFLFMMDEMMILTSDLQGQTNFYYKGRRVIVPESMRKMPRKNWPE